MKDYCYYVWVIFIALGLATLCLLAGNDLNAEVTLQVIPEKIVLSPGLIKEPVQFKGSGFKPKELIVIEIVPPPELQIIGVTKGELVGLAQATCDELGNFLASMAPTATLNWFFQVGWTVALQPDFKQAKPLPPGKYEILVTGMESGFVGRSVLEILSPPKKES